MKPLSFEPIRNWFGYNRRERRASFILIILIVAVISARYVVPQPRQEPEIVNLESVLSLDDSIHVRSKGNGTRQSFRQNLPVKKRQVLELNTCDSAALEGLPGIGPVLARRIIKYRNLIGGFAASGQLREVYGLSDSTFNIISKRVRADSSLIEKINLNRVDYKRLTRLPYLEKYDVTAILKFRELQGRIVSLDELIKNKVLTPEKARKVKAYLEF
jgi:DNA uptake protein and related DNA-binding proteins